MAGGVPVARAARRAFDGDLVATNRVSVLGNGTEAVTLEHTFETAGDHPIAIVGQRIGTVTVEEP